MEALPPEDDSDPLSETEMELARERRFIAEYIQLTGAPLTEARNTFMFVDIIQQRDPYCYRLE